MRVEIPAVAGLRASDRSFVVPVSDPGRIVERIEKITGRPLARRIWRDVAVIRDSRTVRAVGGLACAVSERDLFADFEGLLPVSRRSPADPADKPAAHDLTVYCLDAVERPDPDLAGRFAIRKFDRRFTMAEFSAEGLLADRTIQLVETPHGSILGHGYMFGERRGWFRVEAHESVWSALGLSDTPAPQLEAFVADAFSICLAKSPVRIRRRLGLAATFRAERLVDEQSILVGAAAASASSPNLMRTYLALSDAFALADAVGRGDDTAQSLAHYQASRKSVAASADRANDLECDWTENLGRTRAMSVTQFAFNALTRSLRINHRDVAKAMPAFCKEVDRRFAEDHMPDLGESDPPPPMFVPLRIRGLAIPNRIGVSPMCLYSATDGTPDDFHLVHLGSRAMGGAGLVFTESTSVSPEGRITPGCTGMYREAHIEAWRRIVAFVHANTDSKIAIQLGHAGRRAATARPWEGNNVPALTDAWQTVGPSPIGYSASLPAPREMSIEDIGKAISDFAAAAKASDAAGFDLLEIHMAHGYLLSTFLSPLSNRRTDRYGGTLENRSRFPREVAAAVRAAWPAEKPLAVRISAIDWTPGGSTIEDMVEFSAMLKSIGVDIIDVSTGNVVPGMRPATGRLFQTPFSDVIRNSVSVPTMTVGRISSYGDIDAILAAGRADICLLAKGHLKHPYFARQAAEALRYRGLEWPKQYALGAGYALRQET
ncbi:MAG: bifunctional salicylyl-CoA 5-hydroxylase/oxidoreductase [Alphaproteobacteria bacterium]|nr:bifunctional salicylyl-CoA 5-hydroxylase/oxidoreductase [Alphaproteobacteria bacterium]